MLAYGPTCPATPTARARTATITTANLVSLYVPGHKLLSILVGLSWPLHWSSPASNTPPPTVIRRKPARRKPASRPLLAFWPMPLCRVPEFRYRGDCLIDVMKHPLYLNSLPRQGLPAWYCPVRPSRRQLLREPAASATSLPVTILAAADRAEFCDKQANAAAILWPEAVVTIHAERAWRAEAW